MRTFKEFIDLLTDKDKENFDLYSPIRSKQLYRIIYEALNNKYDFTYSELNSLVRCDKAIKDILYKYLAIVEEMARSYLFSNYDLNEDLSDGTDDIRKISFENINNHLEKRDIKDGEVTYLYKAYSLTFSKLIKILADNKDDHFNLAKLNKVNELRNKVMHHYPLLFDTNSRPLKVELEEQINCLIEVLPERYVKGNDKYEGFIDELNHPINKTREKTNGKFNDLLINIEKR